MTPKFPTRTLVLMTLTLAAFAWFWWQAQRAHTAKHPASQVIMVRPASLDAGFSP